MSARTDDDKIPGGVFGPRTSDDELDCEPGEGYADQDGERPTIEEIEIDIPDSDPTELLRAMGGSTVLHEFVAKICHEANRAYCGELGDHSHDPWDLADESLRQSAIAGVIYHFENPGATPEQSHREWLRYKLADGWVYGPDKNLERKTHPQMVAFGDLPLEQRAKDAIFGAVCKVFSGEL